MLLFPAGSSSKSIAAELERAGVVRSRFAFELLHYVMPRQKLKAGEYRFVRAASGLEVFQRIARGDVLVRTVVVPEGYNIFEIAAAIEAAGLGREAKTSSPWPCHDTDLIRAVDPQAKSLEGYLFPDTYQFSRTMTMREMAATMVKRFQKEAQTLGLPQDAHRLVTLASIVEKETAAPDERPEVASVYPNRLAKNMALAADPTVVYARAAQGQLSRRHLPERSAIGLALQHLQICRTATGPHSQSRRGIACRPPCSRPDRIPVLRRRRRRQRTPPLLRQL